MREDRERENGIARRVWEGGERMGRRGVEGISGKGGTDRSKGGGVRWEVGSGEGK